MKCPNCQYENRPNAIYCSHCGKRLDEGVVPAEDEYKSHVNKVSLFFFTLLAYIAVLNFTHLSSTTFGVMAGHAVFALIILTFFFLNYKSVLPLFSLRTIKLPVTAIVLLIAVGEAVAVYFFGNYLNYALFDHSQEIYLQSFSGWPYPLLTSILFVGVFPAVFEELAFRGILFNELLKVTGTWAVIIVSSILFTILHLSFISALWLFPGAIGLGYLRARYKTVNYGMLAHFAYNTTIVLLQAYLLK